MTMTVMNPPTEAARAWRRRLAWLLAAAALCFGLVACGGGGGGGGGSSGGGGGDGGGLDITKIPVVKVTVQDAFGVPVAGAAVEASAKTQLTDAKGTALMVLDKPDLGTALKVSRESFVDKSIEVLATLGQVNEFTVVLERKTAPAGASLATRSGAVPTLDGTGRQLSFEVELVLVDSNAGPIEGLSQANFSLQACTPNPDNAHVDCVRGASTADDRAYAPLTAAPATLTLVGAGLARPYAAALLLDQSGSVQDTDPTGARLYSAKAFLSSLGADDRVQLAAFADSAGAAIPTVPLTVYGPFRDRSSASEYFASLDALTTQVGGNTPLYASLDSLRQSVASDSTLPAGLTRAVVLFTDGTDTACGNVAACRTRRAQSIQGAIDSQVRLFTIGLSNDVDVVALGELATQTGGAFLYADNAEQLLPLYGSLGKLLSLSLPTYRLRWTVQADAAGSFRSGQTLLGKVQVTVGSGSFDVPFLVAIP